MPAITNCMLLHTSRVNASPAVHAVAATAAERSLKAEKFANRHHRRPTVTLKPAAWRYRNRRTLITAITRRAPLSITSDTGKVRRDQQLKAQTSEARRNRPHRPSRFPRRHPRRRVPEGLGARGRAPHASSTQRLLERLRHPRHRQRQRQLLHHLRRHCRFRRPHGRPQ